MTWITKMGRVAIGALLCLWAMSLFAVADLRDDLAQKTGLDRDLINFVTVDVGGIELTVTFVYINERTFQSKISAELSWTLQPYIGRNAIYVNPSIDAVVSQFSFDPQLISVVQNGTGVVPTSDSWQEITPGFLSAQFVVNPSGTEQGSGSEGVFALDDAIDGSLPFEVVYAGQKAYFEIDSNEAGSTTSGSVTSAVQSHEPIEVAPVEMLGTLQDLLLHEAFSSESMAAAFQLDEDLVRTIVLSPRGQELRLLFVRLEPSIRTSLLGDELIEAVEEVIGTGAVMVWAVSSTGAPFTPWNFYIRQNNTNYVFFSTASFVGLSEGFLRVERVEMGDLAAGVIRLPRSVDAASAFSVFYGTSGVDYP